MAWYRRSRLLTAQLAASAMLIVLAVTVSLGTALAQATVEPDGSAGGYDHVSEPPAGALSSVDWCFAFADRALVGQTLRVEAEGPDGPVAGTGTVGDDGTVKVRVGITSGGTFTVTSVEFVETGTTVATESVEPVEVVFEPAELDCRNEIEPVATETSTTEPPPQQAPTTPVSTTEAPTTPVSTGEASSETSAAATEPGPVPDSDGEGGTRWPLVVVGAGVILLIVGLLIAYWPDVIVSSTTRCERERREVGRIETEIKKLTAEEAEYRANQERMNRQAHRLDFSDAPGSQRQRDEREARRLREEAREQWRRAEAVKVRAETMRGQLAKAKRALDACLERPATGTSGGSTGGGKGTGGGSSAPPTPVAIGERPTKKPCCPSGNWIGINTYGGGGSGYGRDLGTIYLACIDDPSRTAVVTWGGTRAGIFIGVELSVGIFVLVDSGKHPTQLKADVEKVMSGWDWDISVGVSWTKLLKSSGKTLRNLDKLTDLVSSVREAGKATRAIKKAERSGDTATAARIAEKNKEVLDELIREGVADDLADAVAKGTASAKQAGGTGANIPFGGGLQAGFWKALDITTDVISIDGCATCDSSKK